MTKTATIMIDDQTYQVPDGINLVDAAKLHGITIPVFCYHPKMESVGMCRMCLVELGSISVNRDTGEPDLNDDGSPVVRWFPKLQTACTQTVRDGTVVRTSTAQVLEARDNILEFILTSHPLDCPICDKGGECPLQNLTMAYGPGRSNFIYDDKLHLDKHVPLGELIYLDRERCIQCARCTRFCDELVGDDVLAFHERGRSLQIVTISDPPFDTKFSGNTTDICPVGALTTADFRFGARPWELDEVPTICPHCPVGCNLSASTRIDRDFGGKKMIKRIMPRQNELVNEIWTCDKGRFGHHHSRAADRLQHPMMRQGGEWVKIDWATAYHQIASKLKKYADSAGFLAGPTLSNEDLWELRQLAELTGDTPRLGVWPAAMTGAGVVAQVGIGVNTRLQDVGPETAILVIASDLEEEAPIWWLQIKQAADRGAAVVVANARETKLDRVTHTVVHYDYGDAVAVLNSFAARARSRRKTSKALLDNRVDGYDDLAAGLKGTRVPFADAADVLLDAENVIVFAGAEGLTLDQHRELMQAAANLLIITGHVGRQNNGLVPVWPGANVQGALDIGFSPETTASLIDEPPAMWFIGGADPAADDSQAAHVLANAEFVVVGAQFMTATAAQADIILPRQSFAEREGTYTNGMRRVQRFYAAQGPVGDALPDWTIYAQIGARLKGPKPPVSAAAVMRAITQHVPRYAGMGYSSLAHVEAQFPDVGGDDLYYGGTAYANHGGLGVQWATDAEDDSARLVVRPAQIEKPEKSGDLCIVPVRLLYDRGPLFEPSDIMHQRVPEPYLELNSQDAAHLSIADGDRVMVTAGEIQIETAARVNGHAPEGVVLWPRRLAHGPAPALFSACSVQKIEE
ncbi:MAG: NADH-quinone oxidoreductase subunit NuoG [Anaerolineae bacterium]|nr:NADH-quinone oxidoreductase subunit NuoG [Anaerolineae bacterium]